MPIARQAFWVVAMLTASVKGRAGELHLGELLDGHARAHRGRDDLDGLGGVLAEHVRAQDAVAGAVGDELAEPVGVPVGDRAQQIS
jgi:hypothetical protein